MKYILGLLGWVLTYTCVWAAPETMEMYATLSAPISSFWSIKTEGCEPVTMPSGSQLNLGFVSAKGDTAAASTGGTVTLQGSKPLTISKLRMEKATELVVGGNAKWLVSTLEIGKAGAATFNGGLVVNELNLKKMPSTGVTVNVSSALRLGNTTKTTTAEFTSINTNDGNTCSNGDFCFSGGGGGPASASWSKVGCSKNENNACKPNRYLVGG